MKLTKIVDGLSVNELEDHCELLTNYHGHTIKLDPINAAALRNQLSIWLDTRRAKLQRKVRKDENKTRSS